MRKIKKFTAKNWQGHADSVVELHPGINMIFGSTHKGKSSLFRGLRSVYTNEPNHEGIIRDNEASGFFGVHLDNDIVVTKERNRNKNKNTRYYIEYLDGRPMEKLDSFGVNVPKIVTDILECPTFKVDNTPQGEFYLNIATQFDLPFLLTAKGPIKSKVVSKLTGGNILDEAIRKNVYAMSKKNEAKGKLENEIDSLSDKIKNFDYLETAINKVDALLSIINKFKELKLKFEKIKLAIEEYQVNITKLQELKQVVEVLNEYDLVVNFKAINTLNETISTYNKLESMLTKYNNLTSEIDKTSVTVDKLQFVPEYLSKCNHYDKVNTSFSRFVHIKEDYDHNHDYLQQQKQIKSGLSNIKEEHSTTTQVLSLINNYNALLNKFNQYSSLAVRIDKGLMYVEKLKQVTDTYNRMQQFIKLYQQYTHFFNICTENEELLKNSNTHKSVIVSLNTLQVLRDTLNVLSKQKEKTIVLESHLNKYQTLDGHMFNQEREIIKLQKQIAAFNDQLSEFEICPLCKQEL